MSFSKTLAILGSLAMGTMILLASTSGSASEPNNLFSRSLLTSPAEELAYSMHLHGIRKPLSSSSEPELSDIMADATRYADNLDLGCRLILVSEVYFRSEGNDLPVGFVVDLECEDAPGPGVSLYYDKAHQYLAALSIAD